jgi:hypothetical protein
MSRLTRRNITSTKFRGWISQLMEDTLPEKSLISLNAQRWCRMDMYIKKLKSLSGRLLRMMRKTKCSLIEIFSLKGVSLRCRNWMSKTFDYLSEEMYNIWKGDLMPKKKKKVKKKKKKAKKKKKR